jgi:hypothetical protein
MKRRSRGGTLKWPPRVSFTPLEAISVFITLNNNERREENYESSIKTRSH